jgi:acetyl-CoA C-acetyltransferase
MGETAENIAEKYQISRHHQDEYSVETQRRAEAAQKNGRFKDEIVPVEIEIKKGEKKIFDQDEHPRHGTTLEALAKLEPVFRKNGTVHAGNSSGITDAAAAVILADADQVKHLPGIPLAKMKAYTSVGVDPALMGMGPVPAVKKLLDKTNIKLSDIGLVELNEAFAVQVLACQRELNFDLNKVNVNGGAIALGHPIGCTGTRISVTLIHEMKRQNVHFGLATLCVSGGMGLAVLFENVN